MNKDKKALIGVVGWSLAENSFGVTKAYLSHLSNFGEIIILNPMKGIIPGLDLVVLPGGKDSPSFLYGEPPNYMNSDSDQFKEYFVQNNLKQYIEAGVPIWGTCLGFQNIIIHFGGSLCQDLKGHAYSSEYRGELVHELKFRPKFSGMEVRVLERRKKKIVETCSLHHQGAYDDNIPECIDIIAATKDGVVEAIQHKTLPIAAMQCHTEEDYNPLGNYLIAKLILNSPNFKDENKTDSK